MEKFFLLVLLWLLVLIMWLLVLIMWLLVLIMWLVVFALLALIIIYLFGDLIKLNRILKYIEEDENRKREAEIEWIHYRNSVSDYQKIIDDKLKIEKNFNVGNMQNNILKLCVRIIGCNAESITSERLKLDKNIFTKFFCYYYEYFENAIVAKRKAEEKKKKPTTSAEILVEKDFKVEILNKDKKIAEAEEAIAKIKKRTSALFAKQKKEMALGERLRDRERRSREYLQVVEELKEGMSPEQQERLDAEAYQELEKIK